MIQALHRHTSWPLSWHFSLINKKKVGNNANHITFRDTHWVCDYQWLFYYSAAEIALLDELVTHSTNCKVFGGLIIFLVARQYFLKV